MASVLDLVKHYQHTIEKYPNDEQKVLKSIDKLFNLGVTVSHLQQTGVGRTVNALRKEPGEVGQAARALVYKWKVMVAAEESDHEPDHNDTTNCNGNGKDSDDSAGQTRSRLTDSSHERSSNSDQTRGPVNGNSSGSKRKYHSSEEEDNANKKSKHHTYSEKEDYKNLVKVKRESTETDKEHDESEDSHSSDSESEMSESSDDDRKENQKIKVEPTENHKSSSSKQASHSQADHKRESSVSKNSSDLNKPKSHSSESRHSSDKSSSRERSQSSQKHKSSNEKESSSDKKHKSDKSVVGKDQNKDTNSSSKHKSSSDKHSHSEKHKSSSEKHRSSSEKHGSSSEKQSSSSEKHSSSSDRHKSSSQKESKSKHKEGSDKSEKHGSKSEKHSSQSHKSDKEKHKGSSDKETQKHKSRDSSSSSKEKHSSSSKEKSSDRSSLSKEKSSDSHKSEKKSSSHESKSKNDSKYKASKKDDRSSEKKSKDKHSSSSSHKSDKSSSKGIEDVPKTKPQITHTADSDDGIDCGSGASFAEALGMVSPAKPKKKSFKEMSSPNSFINDLSPAVLLAPSAKLAPLPALEISALPEISPNYRPRPPPRTLPHFTDEEAMSCVISSKNQRTKVYSGNKVIGKIPTLYELCVHVLQEHIDALEFTGGVPYEILKPIVDKATPQQLFVLEYHNPYLTEDTDHLWKAFCEKHFRNKKREEMEAWREMYMRCQEEQEDKLKSLTANIRMTTEAKKAPIKQTKMAYVDSVVKPPRNIARKQAQHGTAFAATASPAARVAALAGANVLRPGARAALALPTNTSSSFKPKKAPLMAKALQFMRGRKR